MGVFEGAFPQWAYLVGYNAVSALLWLAIFLRAALACLSGAGTGVEGGPDSVYPAVRGLVLFAQTLAALEILHALIGMSTCGWCSVLKSSSLCVHIHSAQRASTRWREEAQWTNSS